MDALAGGLMSRPDYSDCPILELRPDGDGGMLLVFPLLELKPDGRGTSIQSAAAVLTIFDGSAGLPSKIVTPMFDYRQRPEDIDVVIRLASRVYRRFVERRHEGCYRCGESLYPRWRSDS